jgi:hypothetical protein
MAQRVSQGRTGRGGAGRPATRIRQGEQQVTYRPAVSVRTPEPQTQDHSPSRVNPASSVQRTLPGMATFTADDARPHRQPLYEPFTTLARLGGSIDRIRLGTTA